MYVKDDDLWFCDDCLFFNCNGDLPEDASEERCKEIVEGSHIHDVPHFNSETGEGIEEFSRGCCDACGTYLAGTRHRFARLSEEKE